METSKIEFTRVNNDVNGNPRYVCHFLNLLKDTDEAEIKDEFSASLSQNPFLLTGFKMQLAMERARKIGGKQYRGKEYGGGIVFQSYNIAQTERDILELLK